MENSTKVKCFEIIRGLVLFFPLFLFFHRVAGQNCTVNAGVEQTVCENQGLTLYGHTAGVYKEADTLTTWVQVSGPSAYIVSPNSPTTDVIGIIGGETYTFRFYTTCLDGSLVYQDVVNYVLPGSNSYAGEDMAVCPGTYNLSASALGIDETGEWSIVEPNNGITIDDPTSATSAITVSGDVSGDTYLVWTVTNTADCSSTDTVVVTNRGGVFPVSAGANDTLSHCYSATQGLSLNGSYAGSGIDGQQGTWTVVSGPNVPAIADIHDNTSGVSNLIEGTYVFEWEVEGGCVSGIAYDTIVVPASTADVTDAGSTTGSYIFCDTRTSVVLTGAFPVYTNETVLWEKVSGPDPVNILNPTNHITSVEGLDGSSDYSFRYTITNNLTGCTSFVVVTISYADAPSIDITPGRIDLGCDESVATIPYTSTGDGTVSWSIVHGSVSDTYPEIPTGYVQANENPITISGLTARGNYVIRLRKAATIGSQCESAYDDVTVIVSNDAALANAGTDQFLACNVDTTALAGNNPEGGICIWSQVSGPNNAVFDNAFYNKTKISNLISGTYVFRWIIPSGPFCKQNQDDVEVIVAATTPNQADAGADQTVCINTPVYLEGSRPILNEWGAWTVVPRDPSVVFDDTTSYNTFVEGLAANSTYQLVWSIYNACGVTHDTVTITTNDINGPIVADAGEDMCLSLGTTAFSLTGNDPSPGTGEWTQVNGTGAVISNPTSHTTNVSVGSDGTYYFEWAVTYNNCNPTLDTVRITIADDVTIANAGASQEICGDSAIMAANSPVVGNGTWVQVGGAGGAVIEDVSSPVTKISGLTTGYYFFAWVISNEACAQSSDTVELFVSEPPVVADAGPDQVICFQDTVQMAANVVGDGLWSIVSGPNTPSVSDYSSPTAVFGDLIMGTYVFRWTSGGLFCGSSTDDVVVEVIPRSDVPEVLEYCEATTQVGLEGNINSIGTWRQVSGTAVDSLITTSANTATAYFSSVGTFSFEYEISGSGCSSYDTTTVILLSPPPVAAAGADQTFCDSSYFVLTGNSPQSSVGEWVLVHGPSTGSFFYTNDSTAVFAPDGNKYGIFVFAWKIANGECENEDQIKIINYEPTFADAGADQDIVCDTVAYMDADTVGMPGVGNWYLIGHSATSPTPTIGSLILPDTKITGLGPQSNGDPAVYTFEWVATNGVCNIERDTVEITVCEIPTEAIAGNDTLLCEQTTYTLNANPVTVGNGKWIEVKGPNAPTIADSSAHNTTVSGLTAGTYIFYWETTTTYCSSIDSVIIVNFAEPSAPDPMANINICHYEDLILQNSVPTSGSGSWTKVSGPYAYIVRPDSCRTVIGQVVADTTYVFRWTVSNGICLAKYEDVTVAVYEQPTMSVAGSDQVFCNADTAVLDGNDPLPDSGIWTVVSNTSGQADPTFDDATLYNTTVRGISAGTYTLRWTIYNGTCEEYDEIEITRYPDLTVSNPSGAYICEGGTLTFPVTVGGGTGFYYYQWQDSVSGGSWSNVTNGTGGTTASYTTSGSLLPGAYYFRVVVADCNTVVSGEAELVVVADPQIDIQPTGETICSGSAHTMSVSVSGGEGTFSYQWQQSANGAFWTNVSGGTGATTNSYTTGALTTKTYFRAVVSQSGVGCNTLYSDTVVVYVPEITLQPEGGSVCLGDVDTLYVSVDPGDATLSYQWQFSDFDCHSGWFDISGANGTSYVAASLPESGTRYFRCVVSVSSPDCDDLISDCVPFSVIGCNPLIGISNQLVNVINNGDGTYDALFTIRVQNYGDSELSDIQVTQNLDDAFGAGNYTVKEITSTSFAVETSYNGSSVLTMLTSEGNSLQPGASTDIVLKVTILSEGSYWLTATATGIEETSGGTVVSDVSQNGSDPDPNQDGDPTVDNELTPVNTTCVDATAYAGADAEICSGGTWQVVGADVEYESGFFWATSGDGTFNSASVLSPVYTPGINDISTGTVDLILTANSYGSCPSAVDTMELTIVSIILAAPVTTDANCDSQESGTVQLSVSSGGIPPYTFELSTGESNTTGYFGTLASGGYIYRVTDSNGCSSSGSFEIDDPNELELTVTAEDDETCYAYEDGSATVVATGGTGPYTFGWTGPVTQPSTTDNPNTVTGLAAGIYVVTVTDNNGCEEIETIEIEQPSGLNILLAGKIEPECDNSGQIIVSGEGGVPPYSYSSSSGTVSGNVVSGLSSGNITITITDANGCEDNIVVTLFDDDKTEPTFTCPITDTLYADDNCEVTVPDLTDRVTDESDNCSGNLTVTQSIAAGSVIGSDLTVTLTVTDAAGNYSSCDVLLVVKDTISPTAVCKDITLNLDMTGTVFISADDVDGGSYDNCNLSGLSIDKNTFTCNDLGNNTVVLTVTDEAGNTSACEATVTIKDNIDPIINCPSPVALTADGNCEATVPDFAGTYNSDNCGANVTQNPTAGTVIPKGVTPVTLTAADGVGNISECVVYVTVVDDTPPGYVCPYQISTTTDAGSCHATVELVAPDVDDNCGSASVIIKYRIYAPDNSRSKYRYYTAPVDYQFAVGISQVEWTMIDLSGNVSTCFQEIEITETELPEITCPTGSPFVFGNSTDNCGHTVADASLDAIAADNCGIVSLEHDFYSWGNRRSLRGAQFPVGTTTVTWTATDINGNQNSCSYEVVVNDTLPPEFVNCSAKDTFTVASHSSTCKGSAIWSTPMATDACGEVTVAQTEGPPSGSVLDIGYYTIEYTATDASGNEATCSFVLNITDTEGAVIVCPPDFYEKNDEGVCTWTAPEKSLIPLLAISNCPFDITYEITGATNATGADDVSGTTFNMGTSTVTYTIKEQASSQSWDCSFTITVYDGEAPVVVCPAPVSVMNDDGMCSAEVGLQLPGYTDNCDNNVTVSYMVYGPDNIIRGPFSGNNNSFRFPVGISQVVWYVTDSSGNVATCTQQITVSESEPPEIICPGQSEFIFNSTPGLCGYKISDTSLDVTATDNCRLHGISHNFGDWAVKTSLKGAIFPIGSTEVTWTAVDYAGNTVTCNYTVTVIDNEAPYFVNCPSGVTYTVGLFPGTCKGGAIWSIPVALDECSDVIVAQISGPAQGTMLGAGIYVIKYEAVDASGNKSACSFNIAVLDTEAPVIVCQPNIEKSNDKGTCTWASPANSLSPLLANSNCSASILWHVKNPDGTIRSGTDDVSGYVFELGTSTVYYEIIENTSGQRWDCSFTVTIIDSEAPIIECQDDIVITAQQGECDADVELVVPDYSDDCPGTPDAITYTVYAPDNTMSNENTSSDLNYTFMNGTSRIEWKVTDAAGNYSVCWQTVRVIADQDALAPGAGPNSSICENDSFYIFEATASAFAAIEWTTSGTGHFVDPSLINPVYVPSQSDILDGTVTLTITSSSSCASVSDDMVLSISQAPQIDAGADLHSCYGQAVMIDGAFAAYWESILWETSGEGTFVGGNTLTPVYYPGTGETGEITLSATVSGVGSCDTDTVSDETVLVVYDELIVNAGGDDTIYHNTSTTLNVDVENGSGSYSYSWSPPSLVFSPKSDYTETYELTSNQEFVVTVSDILSGCVGEDSITIVVKNESDELLTFFNAFTPNGDGVNDNWQIEGIENFPENEVLIFNRWGDTVKELQDYDNTSVVWDGTNKQDKRLPDGTYYYIVKIKNADTYTGWVHIRSDN